METTTQQKSFHIRTSRIWNCLADELDLSSSTLASFKSVIFNYYESALAVSYDCEDTRSFILVPCLVQQLVVCSCSFSRIAVFFNISCFFFISILACCNSPQLLRCPCQRSFFLFVGLFVCFLAELIKQNKGGKGGLEGGSLLTFFY